MKTRRIIYDSAIIVLAFIQMLPCLFALSSTIMGMLLGAVSVTALTIFWRYTKIGRGFFRDLWRATLRMERLLLNPDE